MTAPSDLIVIATARAKPGAEPTLENALRDVAAPTRAQPGSVGFSLFRSADDPAIIVGLERWASAADHDRHLQGAHVQRLMSAMGPALVEPPIIAAYEVLDDATVEAKRIARQLAEEVFSAGNMATFDRIIARDYVNHNMPVPNVPGTKDGFRQIVQATRVAFPDVKVHIADMVAEGPFVVFRDNVEATSKADFFGMPPNGKRLAWTEIHFLRIDGGQIVEHWTNFDQLGILVQLGRTIS
jgi:steroid delta-isomerase-like uncharacterized protein